MSTEVEILREFVVRVANGDISLWSEAARQCLALANEASLAVESGFTSGRIWHKCTRVAELLVAKNAAYGNSALDPIHVFADGNAADLIRVRIDDKLSRIRNSPEAFGEDPILDLIGYLVLLQLAMEDEAK